MSLFTEASLVMIPSGVKDGKLYSIKPDDGVGDFTFTRGSNLAATRVDENGLIEKGRENLLLQSNQFDTTWFFVGAPNLTGNQIGYDGTNDAWSLASTGTQFASVRQNISVSQLVTFSTYAKAGSLDFLIMYTDVSFNSVWFNLANGTIGTIESNVIDASIIDVGDGWYRCSITSSSASSCRLYPTNANATFGTTSGNIYIQDAQLELGLVATDYIETGATTEQAGILENLPRLDYTDSSCPSLLLEPTRTNLVTQSEYFADSSWSKSVNPSIFSTFEVSPDGSTGNVYRFSASNANVFVSPTTGVQYTISFYVKSNGAGKDKFKLRLGSNESSTITATNEWVRYSYTATADTAVAGIKTAVSPDNEVDILIYGAQLEAGSYPTSYIPTYGTSVTRSGDNCFGAGDATTFNDNEGCVFLDLKGFIDAETGNRHVSLSDGSINNALIFYFDAGGFLGITNRGSSSSSQVLYKNYDVSQQIKLALNYGDSTGDYKLYINGSSVALEGAFSAKIMTGLNEFEFRYANDSLPFKGTVNKAIYFPTALTDSELAALTTI